MHETCEQYVARRLSEGWRIAGRWRHLVILSPSDGSFLRVVDLRNDVETLRPNAAGDLTQLGPDPYVPNWQNVDEVDADEDATYVYAYDSGTYGIDLYNLPAHSEGSGTINKITVYFRCMCWKGESWTRAVIKSDSTVNYGSEKTLDWDWHTYSQEWALNPADSGAWEWADIDALQIGVYLHCGFEESEEVDCTQVYVEVDYTPAVAPPAYIPRHSGTVGVLMI